MTKTILCIKWGERFGPDYVNKLYGMVSRNITPPFEVHCFTDRPEGINPEVICHELPGLGCKTPENVKGRWRKIALWRENLDGLSGPALFMDLDTVIVGNIDPFFTYGDPDDVILTRNWLRPLQKLGQTTLFRFPVGKHPYVLETLQQDPQRIAEQFQYEQHFVTNTVRVPLKFWPKTWVRHYRKHCLGPYLLRYLRPAVLPRDARIVAFPGNPNPHDALVGQWPTGGGPMSGWQHILRGLKGQRVHNRGLLNHLKSYQMPCPWVKEHWRE